MNKCIHSVRATLHRLHIINPELLKVRCRDGSRWTRHGGIAAQLKHSYLQPRGDFLSILIDGYHQSTFSTFYLSYINMTLKKILRWENSRATVDPRCLINRDFKRQSGISMVLQGSAKGQARGKREGGGRRRTGYYGLPKIHCADTFRLRQERNLFCRLSNIQTNQHVWVKQQSIMYLSVSEAATILNHTAAAKKREAGHSITPDRQCKDKEWKRRFNVTGQSVRML